MHDYDLLLIHCSLKLNFNLYVMGCFSYIPVPLV